MTDVTAVPEALVPQVAQLKAQRANAVAYGQSDIVAAVDRQLAALGFEPEAKEPTEAKEPPETKEKTPEVPQGRTPVNPKQTTAQPDKAK